MKLLFITSSMHKFGEAERILKEYNVIIGRKDVGCEEIRADNCEDVALNCLRQLRRKMKEPFFIEDSGLFIKALNGFPGTYSSWVFKKIGNEGILELMREKKARDASFISSIAAWDGKEEEVFTGEVKGYISKKISKEKGFGYDPIFIPEGSKRTFAEDQRTKMMCSHRRHVLEKLAKWLRR